MAAPPAKGRRLRLRVWLPIVLATALLVPLGVLWWSSLLPASMSVMQMGSADFGTGPPLEHQHGDTHGRSLTDLVADPSRTADVKVDLHAAAGTLTVGTLGVRGYTVNGSSPGPTIRARQGELVEVRFTNDSVPDGATLHWHGVAVPNAMDGVAGVTQDALAPGQSFTYRFVATQAGTFWYHSHQVSHEQVIGGLFGALVIDPLGGTPAPDAVALAHTYAGIRTINGLPGDLRVVAGVGGKVRVRVINTDNATLPVWSSHPVVVAAVDGNEVSRPGPVDGQLIKVGAGGRVDLLVTPPASGAVRVQLSKATSVIVSAGGEDPAEPVQPSTRLDLLSYGEPADPGFDPARPDRHFDYAVTQLPGFIKGRPGVWWAINGKLYPNVPMFVVAEGEVVGMRIVNSTSEVHPMHLHGHRVLVTARDGIAASGSPWWSDSFDVEPGESYDIVFKADNPGIWMDHCHHLEHARDGMIAHLAYAGITTPFLLGGPSGNEPE